MSTSAVPPLPAGYKLDSAASDVPPLPKGYTLDSTPAKQPVSLDVLANKPNDIPLDSYTHATERGLASIGQGVFQAAAALAHPIRTATGIYGAAKDVGSALLGNEDAANRVVNAAKQPFSSPLAFSDFAGNQAGQIIAGMGTEKAIAPVVNTVKAGAQRAVLLGKTPEAAYESALKPSTTIPEAERAAIVQTGLQEGIPVSKAGMEKIANRIDELNSAIADKIKAGAGQGVTVDPHRVASRLADTADKFATQVNPDADLNAVANAGNEFLRNNPNPIPADRAQALKQGTYQQLGSKAYGELGSATMEAQKALARGIKEELAAQIPEISQLNAADSKLYDLQPVLERAVNRIGNHQIMGIGTPIMTGAVKAATNSNKLAIAAGAVKAVLDNPAVKSRLAIIISKGSNVPLNIASGRVAAYQAALADASRAEVQSQP